MEKVKFKTLFEFQEKSHIKAGEGQETGEFKFFICSDTKVKFYSMSQFEGESLIFGTGGKASIHYCESPFSVSTDCVVAKPLFENEVCVKFYFYWFRQLGLNVLQLGFRGSGLQHISKKYINELELPLLDLPTQEKIVEKIEELFSELDMGIEELTIAKARLKEYRQAVLSEIFREYSKDVVLISEITSDIRIGPFGTMLHKSDYIEDGIPIINPKHIKNTEIIVGESECVSEEKALELKSYRLQINDVIMGRRGEMGRVAAITEREHGWICGTGSLLFRLKPEYSANFYAKILSSPEVIHFLEKNATGTTMKNLNEKIVKNIPVPNINSNKQVEIENEIESRLSICDKIEATIEESLLKAERLRQSILKEVFEGRLV